MDKKRKNHMEIGAMYIGAYVDKYLFHVSLFPVKSNPKP